MTDAPLYEALRALAARRTTRMHMPGHKGQPLFDAFAGVFPLDFTETYDTGNLYEQTGPIRLAEQRAAAYYQAADCHFLTGGSTQGVQAMLAAACGDGGTILLDRSCHKSAASACALFDLTPHFLSPAPLAPFGVGAALDLDEAEALLRRHPQAAALLVVSPNYYGVMQDIPALAALCHRYGKKLLVDAAHGPHLPALGLPSPVALGADAAVMSAHKTLPCLGQGAYLIFGEGMDGRALRAAEGMVGTSSPSYPILASLDLARAWLEGEGRIAYAAAADRTAALRAWLAAHTPLIPLTGSDAPRLDPCRLTVCCAPAGLSGHALSDRLYDAYGIACEMADDRNLVCILTGADRAEDFAALCDALCAVTAGRAAVPPPDSLPLPPPARQGCPVRRAWFAPRRTVPLAQAAGCICARPVTPYPPGVPVLWPGEEIERKHIEFLTERCYNTVSEVQICALDQVQKGEEG